MLARLNSQEQKLRILERKSEAVQGVAITCMRPSVIDVTTQSMMREVLLNLAWSSEKGLFEDEVSMLVCDVIDRYASKLSCSTFHNLFIIW